MSKIIVFGTGEYYRRNREILQEHRIIAFIDNDKKKWGKSIDGVTIEAPRKCFKHEYDYVCIMSSFQDEIYAQLISIGVEKSRIIKYQEVGKLNDVNNYNTYQDIKDSVVLLTNNCRRTGAAVALLNLALCLKKRGFRCILITYFKGDLYDVYKENGIDVIIESYFSTQNMYLREFILRQKFVVANTVLLKEIVLTLQNFDIPIIWWLHESLGNRFYNFDKCTIVHKNNLYVYGVGKLAIEAFENKFSDKKIEELLFCVSEDVKVKTRKQDAIIVLCVGWIAYEKGQDIFVDAIKMLSNEDREKCEFLIIGRSVDGELHKCIVEESKAISQIKLLGELLDDELKKYYEMANIIVSSSRSDTMPTVLVEGMINRIPCITSDRTGLAYIIKNNIDGLIFDNLDSYKLAEELSFLINDEESRRKIGEQGFKIYEKYFSKKAFELTIDKVLKEVGIN